MTTLTPVMITAIAVVFNGAAAAARPLKDAIAGSVFVMKKMSIVILRYTLRPGMRQRLQSVYSSRSINESCEVALILNLM